MLTCVLTGQDIVDGSSGQRPPVAMSSKRNRAVGRHRCHGRPADVNGSLQHRLTVFKIRVPSGVLQNHSVNTIGVQASRRSESLRTVSAILTAPARYALPAPVFVPTFAGLSGRADAPDQSNRREHNSGTRRNTLHPTRIPHCISCIPKQMADLPGGVS